MPFKLVGSSRRLLAVLAITGTIIGATVAVVAVRVDGDESAADNVPDPPPAYNRFIAPDDGRYYVLPWDDREISEDAKAATPWYDARWRPFGHCMADLGYEVRLDPGTPYSQSDLDELVRRVNESNPDTTRNRQVSGPEDVDGIARAFLLCAGQWLTIPYEDLNEHGLTFLEPGDVPAP